MTTSLLSVGSPVATSDTSTTSSSIATRDLQPDSASLANSSMTSLSDNPDT
jgi:hypothetical protein